MEEEPKEMFASVQGGVKILSIFWHPPSVFENAAPTSFSVYTYYAHKTINRRGNGKYCSGQSGGLTKGLSFTLSLSDGMEYSPGLFVHEDPWEAWLSPWASLSCRAQRPQALYTEVDIQMISLSNCSLRGNISIYEWKYLEVKEERRKAKGGNLSWWLDSNTNCHSTAKGKKLPVKRESNQKAPEMRNSLVWTMEV